MDDFLYNPSHISHTFRIVKISELRSGFVEPRVGRDWVLEVSLIVVENRG